MEIDIWRSNHSWGQDWVSVVAGVAVIDGADDWADAIADAASFKLTDGRRPLGTFGSRGNGVV